MATVATIRNITLEETQRLQSIPGVFPDILVRELDVLNQAIEIVEGEPKVFLILHVGSNQTFKIMMEKCQLREDPDRVTYQLIPQAPVTLDAEPSQTQLTPMMPNPPETVTLEELQRRKQMEDIAKVQRELEIKAAARQAKEQKDRELLDSVRAQLQPQVQPQPQPSNIVVGGTVSFSTPVSGGSFQYKEQEDGTIELEGLEHVTGATAMMMLVSGYEVITAEGHVLEFHKRSGQIRKYSQGEETVMDNFSTETLVNKSFFVHGSFLQGFISSFSSLQGASR